MAVGVGILVNPFSDGEPVDRTREIEVGGRIEGRLVGGESVVYEFEGQEGQIVSAILEWDGAEGSRFLDVLDTHGEAIGGTNAARLPSNGTYRAVVTRDTAVDSRIYSLSIAEVKPEKLGVPAHLEADAEVPAEVNLYSLEVTGQPPLVVTIEPRDGVTTETNIVDLGSSRGGEAPHSTFVGTRSTLVTQTAGTVGIEVASSGSGTVSLAVQQIPAGALVPGAWTSTKVGDRPTVVDLFVPTPQDLDVRAEGKDGLQLAITLHDPSGKAIAGDGGKSGGSPVRVRATAPVAGTYRIEVTGPGGATGKVDIRVE